MRPRRHRPATAVLLLWPPLLLTLVGAVAWWLFTAIDDGAWIRGIVAFAAAQWTGEGLRRLLRRDTDDGPDDRLTRDDAPALWAEIDDVAALLHTTPPTRLTVTPTPEAGIRPDRDGADLLLGLPLLAALTVGELRAVLAHEYAHLAEGDDGPGARLHTWITRGAATTGPVAWISRLVLLLHAAADGPHARRAEHAADTQCLRAATREEAISAIEATARADVLWPVYDAGHVALFHAAGVRSGITRGFQDALARPLDDDAARAVTGLLTDDRTHPTDTHPSPARRIRRLHDTPPPPDAAPRRDDRPAASLVDDDTLLTIEGRLLVGGTGLPVVDAATAADRVGRAGLLDELTLLRRLLTDPDAHHPVRTYADLLTATIDDDPWWASEIPELVDLLPPTGPSRLTAETIDDEEAARRRTLGRLAAAALCETAGWTLTGRFPGHVLTRPDGTPVDLDTLLPPDATPTDLATALTATVEAAGGRLDVTPGSHTPTPQVVRTGATRMTGPWPGQHDLLCTTTHLLAVPSPPLRRGDIPDPDDEMERLVTLLHHTAPDLTARPGAWTLPLTDITSARLGGRTAPDLHLHTATHGDLHLTGRWSRTVTHPDLGPTLADLLGPRFHNP